MAVSSTSCFMSESLRKAPYMESSPLGRNFPRRRAAISKPFPLRSSRLSNMPAASPVRDSKMRWRRFLLWVLLDSVVERPPGPGSNDSSSIAMMRRRL